MAKNTKAGWIIAGAIVVGLFANYFSSARSGP